jgi:hypothetical protein
MCPPREVTHGDHLDSHQVTRRNHASETFRATAAWWMASATSSDWAFPGAQDNVR